LPTLRTAGRRGQSTISMWTLRPRRRIRTRSSRHSSVITKPNSACGETSVAVFFIGKAVGATRTSCIRWSGKTAVLPTSGTSTRAGKRFPGSPNMNAGFRSCAASTTGLLRRHFERKAAPMSRTLWRRRDSLKDAAPSHTRHHGSAHRRNARACRSIKSGIRFWPHGWHRTTQGALRSRSTPGGLPSPPATTGSFWWIAPAERIL